MMVKWNKVFAMALVLMLSASFAFSASEKPAEQKPVKLKILVLPYLSNAPLFIAEEEGYFAQQGIEIEFVRMDGGSSKAVPALIQRDLDAVAGAISVGMINAVSRGETLRIVADKGWVGSEGCPYMAIIVKKSLIENTEPGGTFQWRGKKIITNPNSSEGYLAEKLLQTAGVSLNDLSVKYNPSPSVRYEAIKTGAADLISFTEPWGTRCIQSGEGILWFPEGKNLTDTQTAVILYGPSLLVKNPEAGRRFMVGYLKAVRQYNQGKTERNLKILMKYTDLDADLLHRVCWPPIRNNGQIITDTVYDFQKWAVDKGTLDRIVATDQIWDSSFIEYANRYLENEDKQK